MLYCTSDALSLSLQCLQCWCEMMLHCTGEAGAEGAGRAGVEEEEGEVGLAEGLEGAGEALAGSGEAV